MKSKTQTILKIMHVLTWIAFIGACIKTGAILYTYIVSIAFNEAGAQNLFEGLNLSAVLDYSKVQYSALVISIILLTALRAHMLYQVILIFLKINLKSPFSTEVVVLIRRISFIAVTIGVSNMLVISYSEQLAKKGISIPSLEQYLGGAGEFLFFGGIIFIIAQVFTKGIELQTENELTI